MAVPRHVVRKCAHFIEYTGLGMLLTESDACVRRNRTVSEKMRIEDLVDRGDGTGRMCALTPDGHVWLELHRIAIFAVPFLDETIQLFTEGRSGQLSDVWLDMAGALTGTVLYLAARREYIFANKERMKIDDALEKKYARSKYKNLPCNMTEAVMTAGRSRETRTRRYREN